MTLKQHLTTMLCAVLVACLAVNILINVQLDRRIDDIYDDRRKDERTQGFFNIYVQRAIYANKTIQNIIDTLDKNTTLRRDISLRVGMEHIEVNNERVVARFRILLWYNTDYCTTNRYYLTLSFIDIGDRGIDFQYLGLKLQLYNGQTANTILVDGVINNLEPYAVRFAV